MNKIIYLTTKEIIKDDISAHCEGRPMNRANIWINIRLYFSTLASVITQLVKNPAVMQETPV